MNRSVLSYEGKSGVKKRSEHSLSLDLNLEGKSKENPPKEVRKEVTMNDTALFIYTSGTTGLPKPCKVLHKKLFYYMKSFSGFASLTSNDRTYVTLPLYHTNGGCLSLSVWSNGGAIVLREKFSAKNFWTGRNNLF